MTDWLLRVRNTVLGLILILSSAAAWWLLRDTSPHAGSNVTALTVPSAAQLLPEMKPAATAPMTAPSVPSHRAAPHADLGRRLQLQREFSGSNDLLGFVRTILPGARAGDVEAQLQIGMALQLCASIAKKVRAANGTASDPDADEISAARLSMPRCAGLLQAPEAEVGTAMDWLGKAAAQGSGQAMLAQAADPDIVQSREERLADVHGAISAEDPMIIFLLAYSATELEPDLKKAAADLTLCAVGYDCSASGSLYGNLSCRRKGCLHADGVERYYELSLSRQQFADALAYSQRLAANLSSGSYDWPEAQALEQVLPDSQAGDAASAVPSNP